MDHDHTPIANLFLVKSENHGSLGNQNEIITGRELVRCAAVYDIYIYIYIDFDCPGARRALPRGSSLARGSTMLKVKNPHASSCFLCSFIPQTLAPSLIVMPAFCHNAAPILEQRAFCKIIFASSRL